MLRYILLPTAVIMAACSAPSSSTPIRQETPAEVLPYSPVGDGIIELSKLEKVDGLDTLNGKPFTGTIVDRHPNGKLRLRRGSLEGKAHGVWIEWHENGKLRFYGEWNSGLGDGPFLYFWDNGDIRERATAVKDIWEGVSEGWTEFGEKRHQTLHRNGELIDQKIFASDDP